MIYPRWSDEAEQAFDVLCDLDIRGRARKISRVIDILLKLKDGHGKLDDVDHLGNRGFVLWGLKPSTHRFGADGAS
ncbi:hypothetical protein CCP3SC1_2480002 [Gammaproteobacteria bacterium]